MIFISKRSRGRTNLTNKETCLSIVCLILLFGVCGGLAGLIYGLIRANTYATITGAIVLGVSLFLSVIFVIIIIFSLKKKNANSNKTHQQQHQHQQHPHQAKQNQRIKDENSLQEIRTISNKQKYEQKSQLHTQSSLPMTPMKFSNRENPYFNDYAAQFSPKQSTSTYLNDSHSSIHNFNARENNHK